MVRAIFLFFLFVIMALMMSYVGTVMTIFLIALTISYLLYPLARKIVEHFHIRYRIAAVLTCIMFDGLVIIFFATAIPFGYEQISSFSQKVPTYATNISSIVHDAVTSLNKKTWFTNIENSFGRSSTPKIVTAEENDENNDGKSTIRITNDYTSDLMTMLHDYMHDIFSEAFDQMGNVVKYAASIAHIIGMCFIIPFLLFFFLCDWPEIIIMVESRISEIGYPVIKDILRDIDNLLSAYIRGVLIVCSILSIYYSIFLGIVGSDVALILGISSGFALLLPFLGPAMMFSATMIISYLDHGLSNQMILISLVYLGGQVFEGSFLTPRIIGKSVGIHPAIIMFSVLASAECFGIFSVIIAVPIAGITAILLKYLWNYTIAHTPQKST